MNDGTSTSESASARVREELGHPVIDADGHIQEYLPHLLEFLRDSLGQPLFDQYVSERSPLTAILGEQSDLEQRTRRRVPQSAWWGTPARNTLDLATSVLPRLLYERLDEFGIDFAVLYPTKAMGMAGVDREDMRLGLCQGFNRYAAEVYGRFADRLTVAGVIPMHRPEEAVAEIRTCHDLGLKVVGLPEGVLRPIAEPGAPSPWLIPGQTHWFDTFGVDTAYDYDPVWEALDELGMAATFHGGMGNLMPFTYTSVTNYVHNHVGFFADRMQKLCKSLFLGGVTNRFPQLNIAFLECGIGWACSLLMDLVEHWEKRNIDALRERLDPATIDWERLEELFLAYGDDAIAGQSPDELRQGMHSVPAVGVVPPELDEFAAAGIETKADIETRFVPRFYFGCEADDRAVAFAFSRANAFGATLRPIFSSDISHWDVEEMAGVVDEAHSLVRGGLLTDDQFRQFVFDNPARLFTDRNPSFFEGTAVQAPVEGLRVGGMAR